MKDRSVYFDRLTRLFDEGIASGAASVVISAGDLHRLVCGNTPMEGRMPVCCAAMRAHVRLNDRVLFEPPKGNGSLLAILYRLPRSAVRKA